MMLINHLTVIRFFRKGNLSLFLLLILVSGLHAQNDSTRSIQLKDIIIQGNRINTPFDESSRNIQVITPGEIRKAPVQSIPEVLSYIPGVDIRQRGPLSVQSDIGIRGGSFEQTLVLINGIKMTDPQTGHHSMNIPLQIGNIQQIEILKGPGARIYGQNAFSGAVNFITRVPNERKADIRLYGGENNLLGGTVDLALPGKFAQYISIGHDRSDGYRYNTDFRINNVFYQSDLSVAGGNLGIMAGFTGRKFGANGFYANPDFSDQYEEVQTTLISIGYKRKFDNIAISPRIYLRNNRDRYLFVRDNPEIYKNLHITNVGSFELNSSWQNAIGETGLGIEIRKETINGDWVRSGVQSKSNLDGFDRNNVGLFLEHQFKFGSFNMTPGVYVNYYSDFKWNAFPGLDMGYQINSNLRIYANAGKSFRVPTFYDMYYESPVEKGNPDLNPEKAISYEFGIRYLPQMMSLEINWFHQDARELIDWISVPLTDSTYRWEAGNITNIMRNGIEIASSIDMNTIFNKTFFIRSFFVSYNFINSNLQEQDLLTRYVLENIRHQFILGLEHKILWKLHHSIRIRFLDRESLAPYWLVDNRLFWEGGKGNQLYIEASNLTDTDYTEIMTPMPGRWIRAGINYTIGF